ncbi:MAG: class I SAM-dependent methyltransferase, partial [Solirubrobacteraceae bacterium]|nr:class I SAM-dependent methyltransferase [Solirubrobacteraceae bacterium]
DGAEAMVDGAARRAEQVGVTQVKVVRMEAEWLDADAASFDAVLSRWGYMLVVDPEAALREARRVLKPGGRIALAAWREIDRNPWMEISRSEFEARGLSAPPEPGAPDPFRFGPEGMIAELLHSAGFIDVKVETVELVWRLASLDDWWEHMRSTSSILGRAVAELSPTDHYQLREILDQRYAPFVQSDGSVELPGSTWVASAEA